MAVKKFLVTLDTECCEHSYQTCGKCVLYNQCANNEGSACSHLNSIGFTLLDNESIKKIDVEEVE